MNRSPPWLLLASWALLVAGCGERIELPPSSTPASGASATDARGPRPLLRLWRDQAPLESVPPEDHHDAGSLWFASQFDGHQLFYRALPSQQGGLAYRELRPRGGELRLSADQLWGVCAAGPVRGGEALSVRVRVRPAHKASSERELPLVVMLELPEPFDPEVTLDREQVLALLDSRHSASHVITGLLGDKTLDLRTDFVTDPGTEALVVFLLAPIQDPTRPVVYESLRVRRFSLSEYVAAGGTVRRVDELAQGSDPAAVRVQLDRDEREGLLAVAPSRFTWELPASAAPRRLELSLGVMPRDAELTGTVRFLVRAGDELLLDETRRAPASPAQAAWEDRLLELPSAPDAPLRLTLASEAQDGDPPLAFFGHPTVITDTGERRPNVVLISLDTLRPDHLGCYGAPASPSPQIDALAEQGLRFAAAYSTSSYTLPSHGSMLTGQYPAFHGAVDVTDALDPARSPLLASILARAGYTTAGFTGGGYVSSDYGFAEGFDRYSHNDPVWAIDTVRGAMLLQTMSWERLPLNPELLRRYDSRAVTRWLACRPRGAPFFLFLHTYIVHNYAPSEPWLERQGLLGRPGDETFQRPFNHKDRERFNKGEELPVELVRRQYLPYYDATISMADAFVGEVLEALEQAGLADDTMVLVTSDHGEEFGEHGFFGHGETLYDGNTRVPLVVRLPADAGSEPGRVLDDPVSLVDIAPWVLQVVGLEPDPRMAVMPPLGPDRFAPPGRSLTIMELDNRRYRTSALRAGTLKLTVHFGQDGQDFETEGLELYDLASDPDERHDLVQQRPDDVRRLRHRLEAYHDLAQTLLPRGGGAVDLSALSPEMVQTLRALGYLGDAEAPAHDHAGAREAASPAGG